MQQFISFNLNNPTAEAQKYLEEYVSYHFFFYECWEEGVGYGPWLEFESVKGSNQVFSDGSVSIYSAAMTFLHYQPGWNLND